jgi:uncharacterized iron-regulated protein
VETVHQAGGTSAGLNARKTIVRQVASGGLASLTEEQRKQLPDEIDTGDSPYKQHLRDVMMVMAHVMKDNEILDKMFTAQVCRDEMMAERLQQLIQGSGETDVIAIVLCGAEHVKYGGGIPSRLKRRLPEIQDRIIILSSSGDIVLSQKTRAMSRNITITHQQLKCFEAPVADYLHVVSLPGEVSLCHNSINEK